MVGKKKGCIFAFANQAEIAQLVEHNLAKVGVASSSLVFRSTEKNPIKSDFFLGTWALVVELVDTQDLKSCEHCVRTGSSPVRSTRKTPLGNKGSFIFYYLCNRNEIYRNKSRKKYGKEVSACSRG